MINLKVAKKKRFRREAEQRAAENRANFGRTKVEKARDHHAREIMDRGHDARRLDNEKEEFDSG